MGIPTPLSGTPLRSSTICTLSSVEPTEVRRVGGLLTAGSTIDTDVLSGLHSGLLVESI